MAQRGTLNIVADRLSLGLSLPVTAVKGVDDDHDGHWSLASGWGLRQALLALSCFTLGHAITLAASALGGLAVPARAVEPAIALTIVGMALFDRWAQRRRSVGAPALPQGVRLARVLGCALIHGL